MPPDRAPDDPHPLERILAGAPGVFCVFERRPDGGLRMPYASAPIAEVYGVAPRDVAHDASAILDRFHPDDRDGLYAVLDASERDLTPWRCESRYLHPTRGPRWLECHASPVPRPDGGLAWHGITQDVTARKRDERRLIAHQAVSRLLAEGSSAQEVAPALLEAIGRAEGLSFGTLWVVDPAALVLRATGAWHADDAGPATPARATLTRDEGAAGRAWATGEVTTVGAPPDRGCGHDARSHTVALPVSDGAGVVGVLEFGSPGTAPWSRAAMGLLHAVAHQLGTFLERTRARQELRTRDMRLQHVIAQLTEGVVITDAAGRLLHWNRAAMRMHGVDDPDAFVDAFAAFPKTHALTTANGTPLPSNRWPMPQILGGERVDDLKATVRRTDGEWERTFSYSGSLVEPGDGTRLGLLMIVDITDMTRATAALHDLNVELEDRVARRTAELEVANADLEAFTYSVSHDLRAPLRAINGYAELLRERHGPELSPDAGRWLEVIGQGGRRMSQLIDDLLAFSRLGRQALRLEDVDMDALVSEALVEVRDTHPGAVRVARAPLPGCRGDAALLRQVWINLLSNAFKFSRGSDPAHVAVEATQDDDEVTYFVRDEGVGFDPSAVDQLFGVFRRLHPSEHYEGSGVGLAIAHRIVLRHGGRIGADGAVGRGATFWFTLPRSAR